MYIGGGIFLLVVGAILAFAVSDTEVGGIDLAVIGWICMGGGALAIVLSFLLASQRRTRAVPVEPRRVVVDDPTDPRY
jgi:hypothetical protein